MFVQDYQHIYKKTKKSKEENEHLHAMCKFYKDKIWSYENDVDILKSQVWEIGDKLLLTERQREKETSRKTFKTRDVFTTHGQTG